MMKKIMLLPAAIVFALMVNAQQEKETRDKELREVAVTGKRLSDTIIKRKDADQKVITLRFKGEQAGDKKYTIEVDGDKIKVNGKDISEMKDVDVSVGRNRVYFNRSGGGDIEVLGMPFGQGHVFDVQGKMREDWNQQLAEPRPLLGINMEKTDKGVSISGVTENSGASKAGIQKGDIITSIDGKKVTSEMDVTKMIAEHKPGDQVEVGYTRDGKDGKVKATLGKKEPEDISFWFDGDNNKAMVQGYKLNLDKLDMNKKQFEQLDKLKELHGDMNRKFDYQLMPDENFQWNGGQGGVNVFAANRPRLGVGLKETESGKGLEVTSVDENSVAAKAGIQKGDIITDVAGKSVNTIEDVRKLVAESKDKAFNLNYNRNGKSMSSEIKFPKKLKEGNL